MSYERAARKYDPVSHTYGAEGSLLGGIAWAIFSEVFPTKWSEIWKLIPVSKVFQGARLGFRGARWLYKAARAMKSKRAGKIVDGATGYAASEAGKAIGENFDFTREGVKEGSKNVFTNLREAARVDDPVICDSSQIAQGSKLISINLKPAARRGDKTKCDGKIEDGSPNVLMGGDPTESTEINEREYFLPGLNGFFGGATKGVIRGLRDRRIRYMSSRLRRIGKNIVRDGLKEAREGAVDDIKDKALEQSTGGYAPFGGSAF